MMRMWVIAVIGVLALPVRGAAHQGPPFALFVDRPVGPYKVSLWGDPDVGTGTFYIILDGAGASTVTNLEVTVRPVSHRLPAVRHRAARQHLAGRAQYQVEVPFDAQERWRIAVNLAGPAGAAETSAEVEVTPPGLGPWDLLLYGAPFAAIAALWVRAFLRRARAGPSS